MIIKMTSRIYLLALILIVCISQTFAQIGSFRNDFAIGVNGGYQLNNIAFVPKVPQSMHGGINYGITARYVCEKYFNAICAIQIEANIAETGWKEKILDINDQQCIINETNEPAEYSRTIKYLQIPFLAHLGFGREVSGGKFFLNVGPQFGLKLSEKTTTNFTVDKAFDTTPSRVSQVVAQDTMAVENNFDYGITAGVGVEFSMRNAGHFLLEARYYYGLGNIFGNTKADYFARSNHNAIVLKGTYLFDIIRTRNCKRK